VGAAPTWADHFKPLSPDHTSYGVAQLNYGDICCTDAKGGVSPAVTLWNPNHVTQVAALLVYESARGPRPGKPEVFVGCAVRQLTPHASVGIPDKEIPENKTFVAKYAEVIWVPVDKVNPGKGNGATRRIADGLGGYFSNHGTEKRDDGVSQLAHPGLFSLPSDDVVFGQRKDAIGCVRKGLLKLGLSPDVFSEFGIE